MASIIKLQGKKGVTYKAVIRRKGYKTITRAFPTRTAAKAFARDTEGNTDRLSRLGAKGSRMTLGEVIEDYAREYRGKDQSAPTKIAYWKDHLGDWKLSAVIHLGCDECTEEHEVLKEAYLSYTFRVEYDALNQNDCSPWARICNDHSCLGGQKR
jgi:hypothetical protein